MISTISHHADRAAALLDQLPRGALSSERAAIVQRAIDAETAPAIAALIEAMGSEVIEGCWIHEAVAILISQRDNARNEADTYRATLKRIDDLNAIELPAEADALTRAEKAEAEAKEIRTTLREYLSFSSIDGRAERQPLREKLALLAERAS